MWLALGNLVQTSALALLLLIWPGDMPATPSLDAHLAERCALGQVTAVTGASPQGALGPPGPDDPATVRPCAGPSADGALGADTTADATPISERRARAVAMTVFSLGSVIGAGFVAGYLIKRLM